MGMIRWWPWWAVLFWFVGSLSGITPACLAQPCSKTLSEAMGWTQASAFPDQVYKDGYRIVFVRWDPVLRQQWARVVNCGHPERPPVELPLRRVSAHSVTAKRMETAQTESALTKPIVVRAGDAVQLWSQQGDMRIDVAAIAEQSGGLGQIVRVRLKQRQTLGQQIEEEFSGVVRGPHDVEMQ